jgi:hypothetical protein
MPVIKLSGRKKLTDPNNLGGGQRLQIHDRLLIGGVLPDGRPTNNQMKNRMKRSRCRNCTNGAKIGPDTLIFTDPPRDN